MARIKIVFLLVIAIAVLTASCGAPVGVSNVGEVATEVSKQVAIELTVNAIQSATAVVLETPIPPMPTSDPITTVTKSATPTGTAVPADPTATPSATPTPLPIVSASTPTIAEVVSVVRKSVVGIATDVGTGSGMIVEDNGYILTNAHVIDNTERITVYLDDHKPYVAEIVGIDLVRDIALLKVDETGLEPIAFAAAYRMAEGEEVIALGYPHSELTNLTVTRGIISAFRPNLEADVDYIQTDAQLNHGNSGGPLIDRKGNVVGMNTSARFDINGAPVPGFGFAISTDDLNINVRLLKTGLYGVASTPTRTPLPTRFPTQAPATWSKYLGSDGGYTIDIAPGWTVDESDGVRIEGDDEAVFIITEELSDLDFDLTSFEVELLFDLLMEDLLVLVLGSHPDFSNIRIVESETVRLDSGHPAVWMEVESDDFPEFCNVGLVFSIAVAPPRLYGFLYADCSSIYGRLSDDMLLTIDSFNLTQPYAAVPPTATRTPRPTSTPTQTITSDQDFLWETYVNHSEGFLIDYPVHWNLDDSELTDLIISSPDGTSAVEAYVIYDITGVSLDALAESQQKVRSERGIVEYEHISLNEFTLNSGVKAIEIEYIYQEEEAHCLRHSVVTMALYNSNLFGIESLTCEYSLDQHFETAEQIRKSFELLPR